MKVLLPASLQGAVDGVRKCVRGTVCANDQGRVSIENDSDRGEFVKASGRAVLRALPWGEEPPRIREQDH